MIVELGREGSIFATAIPLVEGGGGRVGQGDQLADGVFFLRQRNRRLGIDHGQHFAGAHSAQKETVGLDPDHSIFLVEDEVLSHICWMPASAVAMPLTGKIHGEEMYCVRI